MLKYHIKVQDNCATKTLKQKNNLTSVELFVY